MPKHSGIVRKTVELSKDNVDWLNAHYPKNLWAILDMLLEKFRFAHDKTPEDYAEIGARELKQFLDDGGIRGLEKDDDGEYTGQAM